MPSQPSHPLPPPSPPALNLFQHQGLLQCVGCLHKVAKVLGFSISPSNEYLGLIYFRIDCLTSLQSKELSSLFQHRSSKASILWRSAFFGFDFMKCCGWFDLLSRSRELEKVSSIKTEKYQL